MEKASIGRKNVRFLDPSENADFTSRVLVITTAHPCPNRWPTMHTVIAEKRVLTEQHDQKLSFPWWSLNYRTGQKMSKWKWQISDKDVI